MVALSSGDDRLAGVSRSLMRGRAHIASTSNATAKSTNPTDMIPSLWEQSVSRTRPRSNDTRTRDCVPPWRHGDGLGAFDRRRRGSEETELRGLLRSLHVPRDLDREPRQDVSPLLVGRQRETDREQMVLRSSPARDAQQTLGNVVSPRARRPQRIGCPPSAGERAIRSVDETVFHANQDTQLVFGRGSELSRRCSRWK